jgi:hypothetical protein
MLNNLNSNSDSPFSFFVSFVLRSSVALHWAGTLQTRWSFRASLSGILFEHFQGVICPASADRQHWESVRTTWRRYVQHASDFSDINPVDQMGASLTFDGFKGCHK